MFFSLLYFARLVDPVVPLPIGVTGAAIAEANVKLYEFAGRRAVRGRHKLIRTPTFADAQKVYSVAVVVVNLESVKVKV